jgi:hypothetical protein
MRHLFCQDEPKREGHATRVLLFLDVLRTKRTVFKNSACNKPLGSVI